MTRLRHYTNHIRSASGPGRRLWLPLAVALLASACGVNELPQYRSRINEVQLAPRVDRVGEIVFVSPAIVDPNDPESVALDVMEQRVRRRLAERLDHLAHPDLLEARFGETLRNDLVDRFGWSLVEAGQEHDTLFAVHIEHYGISVNDQGMATLYLDTTVEGRFVETGALIYEKRLRTELPLTERYQGNDPIGDAAARVMNLMALDQLTDAAFQTSMLDAVEQASRRLADEMLEDSYE